MSHDQLFLSIFLIHINSRGSKLEKFSNLCLRFFAVWKLFMSDRLSALFFFPTPSTPLPFFAIKINTQIEKGSRSSNNCFQRYKLKKGNLLNAFNIFMRNLPKEYKKLALKLIFTFFNFDWSSKFAFPPCTVNNNFGNSRFHSLVNSWTINSGRVSYDSRTYYENRNFIKSKG